MTPAIVRTLIGEHNVMQLLIISWCWVLALPIRSKQIFSVEHSAYYTPRLNEAGPLYSKVSGR